MRALLLAAGLGTRLRPLTDTLPKCLVPIHGQPLLDIWLERLSAAGIGPFLINTHYLAASVEEYVMRSAWCAAATLVNEAELLGTAGTLRANLDFFNGEDGLLIHADNYCLADFAAFVEAHRNRPSGCVMTMMSFRTPTPESCGILETDAKGIVTGFHEKVASPPGNLANAAIYALSPELLEMMRNEFKAVTDFSTQVLPRLLGRIYMHETRATMIDIGTPEAYATANESRG